MTNQTLHTSQKGSALFGALLFLVMLTSNTKGYAFHDPPTASYLEREAFILRVSQISKAEQSYSGIPASITAAQAIFESSWGKSPLAVSGNNYFGIKCKSWWTGETILHQDDDYDEEGNLTYSCFRAYENIEESFTDHSLFLMNSERYAPLFKLDPTDYKAWAHGLKKCGYATDPKYAQKIIGLIERLALYKLDRAYSDVETGKQVDFALSRKGINKAEKFKTTTAEKILSNNTPPPPTPIPGSYVPTGNGARPGVRSY